MAEARLLCLLNNEENIQNGILEIFESDHEEAFEIVQLYEALQNYYKETTSKYIKMFVEKRRSRNKRRRIDTEGEYFTSTFIEESSEAMWDILNLSKFHSDEIRKICRNRLSVEDEGISRFSYADTIDKDKSNQYASGNDESYEDMDDSSSSSFEESVYERTIQNSPQSQFSTGAESSSSGSDTGVFDRLTESLKQLAVQTEDVTTWISTQITHGKKKKIIETVLSQEKIIHFTTKNAHTSQKDISVWPHVIHLVYPNKGEKEKKKLKQYLARIAKSETNYFGSIISKLIKIHEQDCPACPN